MSDLGSLTAHLEKQKQMLAGPVPEKHVKNGTAQAYREYLQREIARTSKKVEDLKLVTPKGK
jgi:hypothetical protein